MNQVSDGQVQYSGNEFIGVENQEEAFNKWADKEVSPVLKDAAAEADSNEKLFSQWGTLPTFIGSDQNKNIYGWFFTRLRFYGRLFFKFLNFFTFR